MIYLDHIREQLLYAGEGVDSAHELVSLMYDSEDPAMPDELARILEDIIDDITAALELVTEY